MLRGQLPTQPGPLWFKVRQGCEHATLDWDQVPASGNRSTGLKAPAARLQETPAIASPAVHHH